MAGILEYVNVKNLSLVTNVMNVNKNIMNFLNARLAPAILMAPKTINAMSRMGNVIVTIITLLARIATSVQKITGISPNVKVVYLICNKN